MDDRQAQIKEGAGLEDSRINTELIEFLNKWSQPFFVLLLIAAGALFGWQKWQESKIAAIDQAFMEYEGAVQGGSPSPSTLSLLAEEFMDTASVGLMAKLNEADVYFTSVLAGLQPGSVLDPATGEPNPQDVLTEEDKEVYLDTAGRAFGDVLGRAEADNKPLFAVPAAFGSAAVLASQGDLEAAKAMYERAGTIASDNGLRLLAGIAAERAAGLDDLPEITLYAQAELPELPVVESDDPLLNEIVNPAPPEVPADDPVLDAVTDPLESAADAVGEAVQEAIDDVSEVIEDADAGSETAADETSDGSTEPPAADQP